MGSITMKTERQRLEKKLDDLIREIVRYRDRGICYTCGRFCQSQVGHYIPRAIRLERWNVKNCHCQCIRCNYTLEGNKIVYREKLINQYGIEEVEKMEKNMRENNHFTIEDLKQIKINLEKIRDEIKEKY